MDIYAQPHFVAPIVCVQQAPFDPSRRALGVSGNHTSLLGEHSSERQGGAGAQKPHFTSIQASSSSGDAKTKGATLGISPTGIGYQQLGVYATGDAISDVRNASTISVAGYQSDEVSRLCDQRMRLLAARYEKSDTSAEILARLAILDARLSVKAPRVSKAQLDVLEQNLDILAKLQKNREVMASKFAEIAKR